MTMNDFLALPWVRWVVPLGTWLEHLEGRIKLWFNGKKMIRIGIVGDLSMQAPGRLDRVLADALANSDIVVQVGDVHPAYDVVRKHFRSGKLYIIPGNHDDRFETLGHPRQWIYELPLCTLIGLDNANDHFSAETWKLLGKVNQDTKRPIIVFAHKPISTILLPDGSENNHIMGESRDPASAIAARNLQDWLRSQEDILFVCGHWHSYAIMRTDYSTVLIEGRGGAAPQLAYSLLTINEDGMSIHQVLLD